jgi:hypothetical protein
MLLNNILFQKLDDNPAIIASMLLCIVLAFNFCACLSSYKSLPLPKAASAHQGLKAARDIEWQESLLFTPVQSGEAKVWSCGVHWIVVFSTPMDGRIMWEVLHRKWHT